MATHIAAEVARVSQPAPAPICLMATHVAALSGRGVHFSKKNYFGKIVPLRYGYPRCSRSSAGFPTRPAPICLMATHVAALSGRGLAGVQTISTITHVADFSPSAD